jgi:adenylate kinase
LYTFSTGDILRGELAAKSKLDWKQRVTWIKGNLCLTMFVIGMIEVKIDQNPEAKGFYFRRLPAYKGTGIGTG